MSYGAAGSPPISYGTRSAPIDDSGSGAGSAPVSYGAGASRSDNAGSGVRRNSLARRLCPRKVHSPALPSLRLAIYRA